MHLLLHILSFLSTPQSQEPLLTRVDIGVSTQPCERFHYEGDGYLVLVPFECMSLPVLHSLSISVQTDEWVHSWDVTFVLIIMSTPEGACAGPLIGTLSYNGQCMSYTSGPAAAILVTTGVNFLIDLDCAPTTVKSDICPNYLPIQDEVNFTFPKPLYIYPICMASGLTLLHLSPSSDINLHGFNPSISVIALDAGRSTRTE